MSVSTPKSGAKSLTGTSSADGRPGGGPFRPWPDPTADEILASNWFKRQDSQSGAIGWALSQPDGTVVDLPAEAISGQWYDGQVLGLREWFEPVVGNPRVLLYLDKPVSLNDSVTVDVIGATLTTLPDGKRALVGPQAVYAYTDQDGKFILPLPWLKGLSPISASSASSLNNSSTRENWPWKLKIAP